MVWGGVHRIIAVVDVTIIDEKTGKYELIPGGPPAFPPPAGRVDLPGPARQGGLLPAPAAAYPARWGRVTPTLRGRAG